MAEGARHRAYLSLGSNINPESNLPAAVRELSTFGKIVAVSRVWESAPVGFTEQANFLNAAVLLETTFSADAVWTQVIPSVERRLGRVRDPANKNAPRTIDVDLSLLDDEVVTTGTRLLPDPEILKRSFVALPLAELDRQYVHPTAGRSLGEIAKELTLKQPLQVRSDVSLRPPTGS
jgi:2-amino-4-hydroxy-6-hydroxymethyldihydropteridine diphosphokinase